MLAPPLVRAPASRLSTLAQAEEACCRTSYRSHLMSRELGRRSRGPRSFAVRLGSCVRPWSRSKRYKPTGHHLLAMQADAGCLLGLDPPEICRALGMPLEPHLQHLTPIPISVAL